MRLLLFGGNEELQRSSIYALLAHGHQIRLLSSHAKQPLKKWPSQVDPWPDDSRAVAIDHAMSDCEAAIALGTFGVRSSETDEAGRSFLEMLKGANASGLRRFIYVSAAPSRTDGYLDVLRTFSGEWLALHAPHVYGIGDDLISFLLIMMRSLPAVPISGGRRTFRPLWHIDLADALAASLELDLVHLNRSFELVGRTAPHWTTCTSKSRG